MKKILAFILALTMATAVVPAALSVSAADTEVKTFRVGGNRGDWSNDGTNYRCYSRPGAPNFGLYVLGNALDGEVTLSADLTHGQQYGFMFGINDANGDNSIAESGDQYYLVNLITNANDGDVGQIGIERNDKAWGNWAAKTEGVVVAEGQTATVTATYTKTADAVTIVVFVNGEQVLEYTDNDPLPGVGYGLASKSDGYMRNVVAPDIRDSALSQRKAEEIEFTKERIIYKANTAKRTGGNLGDVRGAANEAEALENLFDGVNAFGVDASRFCAVYGARAQISITWETETTDVATYLVFYGGPNVGSNNRSVASFVLWGSTNGENWEQIASVGRVHLRPNNSLGGVHLDNDKAYNHYKIDMVKTEGDEIESFGLNLYTNKNVRGLVPTGTLLSQDATKDVIATKEKIPMDSTTLTTTNVSKVYGDLANGHSDYEYSLFDDAANNTRFALDRNRSLDPAALEWSIADTSNPLKPAYLVLTTGHNTATNIHRVATQFKLYGATANGEWEEIAFAGPIMQHLDNYSYGIKLVNTKAYTKYKFEFQCEADSTNNLAFQLEDLSIFADANETDETPEVYGYVQTKAGTAEGTKDIRLLAEASETYLAKYTDARLTITFTNAEGKTKEIPSETVVQAYTSVIANGETVTAREGYGFIGIVVTGVTDDVVTVSGKVTFTIDGVTHEVELGSAKIG